MRQKATHRQNFMRPRPTTNFGPWDFQVTAEKAMQSKTCLEG